MHKFQTFVSDRLITAMKKFISNHKGAAQRTMIVWTNNTKMVAICERLVDKGFACLNVRRRVGGGGRVYQLTHTGVHVMRNYHSLRESEREVIPFGPPTDYKAGSAEKLQVLYMRALKRQQLFHPQDNQELAKLNRSTIETKIHALIYSGRDRHRVRNR